MSSSSAATSSLGVTRHNSQPKMGRHGGEEDGEEGWMWGGGRGRPMCHVCVWSERGGDVVAHHWQSHGAGSWWYAPWPQYCDTASKLVGEPYLVYFNNRVESRVKIMSIMNEIIFILSTRERGWHPVASNHCSWRMSFGGHFCQPVPIATHRPIGQAVPYWWMCSDWHGLAKNTAKTNSSWWGCCATVRVPAACFMVVLWLSDTHKM